MSFLTPDTEYDCEVTATNSFGTSLAAMAQGVTPPRTSKKWNNSTHPLYQYFAVTPPSSTDNGYNTLCVDSSLLYMTEIPGDLLLVYSNDVRYAKLTEDSVSSNVLTMDNPVLLNTSTTLIGVLCISVIPDTSPFSLSLPLSPHSSPSLHSPITPHPSLQFFLFPASPHLFTPSPPLLLTFVFFVTACEICIFYAGIDYHFYRDEIYMMTPTSLTRMRVQLSENFDLSRLSGVFLMLRVVGSSLLVCYESPL